MKKNIIILSLIILFGSAELIAQSRHYNSNTLGMGGGGTAYAGSYHANFINPANLMLETHRQQNTIGIMGGVGLNTGGSLLNVTAYNKYLTKGLVVEGQVRENLLNDWFGTDHSVFKDQAATVSIVPLGFSHRGAKSAFSLATRLRVTERLKVNRGVFELMTYGLDSQQFSSPVPVNFGVNTVSFAEVSVGYARQVLTVPNLFFAKDVKLFAGVAPKYLYGVYSTALDFNSTVQIQSATATQPFGINHKFDYSLRTIGQLSRGLKAYEAAYNINKDAVLDDYVEFTGDDFSGPQATGFGMDMGATLQMDISSVPIPLFTGKKKVLRVSMSVTDLGKLTYDEDASNVFASGEVNYSGAHDADDIDTYFENLADSLTYDVYGAFDSQDIDGITYKLPAMYNFGASLEMGKLLMALDYGFGFNNNGTNSRRSVVNAGLRYDLFGFMPISVGTRMGGFSSTSYSAGFGFDFNFLELTIGASMVKNSEKNGFAASAAWSGLVIRL